MALPRDRWGHFNFEMGQLGLFDAEERLNLTEEVFEAYFDCRRNKRNSPSALRFEMNFEERLFELRDQLLNGSWRPSPSTAFIVQKPVKREVFAATFSDRVVHHWLMSKLNPHFETLFIEDSYACRVGKGTLYGIRRLEENVRESYKVHPRGCFVLKLDIRGFFMSIPRLKLWNRLEPFIREQYKESDLGRVLQVAECIVKLDASRGCRIAGRKSDWEGLPPDKSLFGTAAGCGLPIGNLTSQVLANFYLHPLDAFIRHTLGFKRYGRYVDDFYIVGHDPQALRIAVSEIRTFLADELALTLHPKKISLQHAAKGTAFLGAVVWPTHTTVGKRLKANFHQAVRTINQEAQGDASRTMQRLNSYLGLMRHFRSYRLRRTVIRKELAPHIKRSLRIPGNLRAIAVRQ
jgi:retron-type reverse transcriptase